MKKRLLAAIMSLCMIVSLLPMSAMAYEGDEEPAAQSRDRGYSAYFYMVKPDQANNEILDRNTAFFDYVGMGSVGGEIPAPDKVDQLRTYDVEEHSNWKYTPPNIERSITVGDTTYRYWDGSGAEPNDDFYTIEWYRYTSASGATGSNGEILTSENCWHVDGYTKLSDKVTVQFQVAFPDGKTSFVDENGNRDDDTIWYLNKGKYFKDISKTPSMGTITEGGTTYKFDGWYTGDDFNTKVTEDTQITKDTIFCGRYVEKGPDLTVTKELTKVVRDGAELTGALSNDTTLYAGDVVTWEIKVTNHTDSIISNLAIKEDFKVGNFEIEQFPDDLDGYTLSAVTAPTDNLSAFSVESKQSKTFEVSYTIKSYDDGNILSNTVTVQNSEVTASASTENDIGYTIKVTYDGNGGTLTNKSETKTVTARVESTSNNYTVEDDSFGFSYSGHTFAGWYTQQGGTGENVTGETVSIAGSATYYAKWTEDEEPVDPDTDIFFFISLPSNDEAMSGSENDYRYLTHGGVIDKDEAGIENIDATGITSLDNESEITKFVSEWPTAITDLPGETNVGFNIASPLLKLAVAGRLMQTGM